MKVARVVPARRTPSRDKAWDTPRDPLRAPRSSRTLQRRCRGIAPSPRPRPGASQRSGGPRARRRRAGARARGRRRRGARPAWNSNLHPDFDVCVIELLFGSASRTRREPSIRPKVSRIDLDSTELESSEVWSGRPSSLFDFHTARSGRGRVARREPAVERGVEGRVDGEERGVVDRRLRVVEVADDVVRAVAAAGAAEGAWAGEGWFDVASTRVLRTTVPASSALRGTIARPKLSRRERTPAEREVGHVAPVSRPGRRGARARARGARAPRPRPSPSRS